MRIRSLLLVVLLTAAAACEPQSSGEVAAEADTTTVPPALVATEPNNLVVTLAEWQVGLSSDTVQAGQLAIQVMNRGNEYHRLEIEGNGMEWVSDSLRSNGELLAQVQLAPGVYELYCPIVGAHGVHRELGMIDTLVVQ